MRLGLNLGYQTPWSSPKDHLALAQEADRLGYSSVWAAEAYGSDSPSILAWIAGQTERIDVGTAVMQIPARTPATTAMTAATIDTISGGRFRLGLGVSGPQVSEGWHGVRYGKPLARTRQYIEIVKLALSRKQVVYEGEHYTLPLPDGPGKALRLSFHPLRSEIPIYLAAVGPKNLELAGELTDGWLAVFFDPGMAPEFLASIAKGRAKVGKDLTGFDIVPSVPVVLGDDPRCARSSCGGTRRSTSAGWAAGRRTSTTNSRRAWVTARRRARFRSCICPAGSVTRPRPCRSSSSTARRCSGRCRASPSGCASSRRPGVTTLAISLFTGDAESGQAALRSVAEAHELSGTGD
jgi:F420-dependent oxidoreductase-like protein